MAEFLSDDEREGDGGASPMRSGSADWELVLSTSSSPVLQSVDELSGLEIGGVHGLSLPGPAFEPDGLVQDDYFGLEGAHSDDFPPTSCESATQGEVTGLSFDSNDDDTSQIRAPLTVSSDARSIDPSSPPLLVVERENDVRRSTVEPESCAEDMNIDGGLQLSREFNQGDPALLSGPSSNFSNPSSSSGSSTPMSDVDRNGEQDMHHHGQSFLVDEGGQSEVASDTGTFDLVLGDSNTRDDSGGNSSLEGGPVERRERPLCDCWLQRQLCLWQARLGQAKTLCSVTLAAAIVGILILGRGWRRLRAQNKTLLLQLRAKDKKITQLMFQLLQIKESLSKTRQIPVIRAKPSLQIPQDRF